MSPGLRRIRRGSMPMTELQLGRGDDGRTVAVAPGQIVVVSLPEDATTGYAWDLECHGPLELIDDEWLPPHPEAMGGMGMRTARFRVVGRGPARISARHWREWVGAPS